MEITTRSGNSYFYDRFTNRIELTKGEPLPRVDRFEIDERSFKISLSHFSIEMTQQCNFRCKYCCYSGEYAKWRKHNEKKQTKESLEDIISFISNEAVKDGEISISFYGGESLLVFNKIRFVIQRLIIVFKERISFSISTNGYLLTKPVIDWICSVPRVNLSITIDGDEKMHNLNRVLSDGTPTHRTIINNLLYFHDKYPLEYTERVNYIATIEKTSYLIPLNEAWMKTPLLKEKLPVHVSTIMLNFQKHRLPNSPIEEKLATFYIALDHYKQGKTDVLTNELQKITNSIKKRAIYNISKESVRIASCLSEMDHCFIDCDGNIAPCERLCESFRIGNVRNGIDDSLRIEYNKRFEALLNSRCNDCWAQRLCNICPKQLEYNNKELDYLCKKEKDLAYISLLMFCEMVELQELENKK